MKPYARIENGVIAVWPVYENYINARNISTDIYYPCYYDTPPYFDPHLEQLVEKPVIVGTSVYVSYQVQKKTLEDLFNELAAVAGVTVNGEIAIDLALVPPALFDATMTRVKERVQQFLDNFAASRGYDHINSVCSYLNSTNVTYQTEAQRGILLRDQTWMTLNDYLVAFSAGTVAVPLSWYDVALLLPDLTWS